VLIKILELVLFLILIQAAVRMIFPPNRNNKRQERVREKRFDVRGQDVSDADYEEARK